MFPRVVGKKIDQPYLVETTYIIYFKKNSLGHYCNHLTLSKKLGPKSSARHHFSDSMAISGYSVCDPKKTLKNVFPGWYPSMLIQMVLSRFQWIFIIFPQKKLVIHWNMIKLDDFFPSVFLFGSDAIAKSFGVFPGDSATENPGIPTPPEPPSSRANSKTSTTFLP